jgi:hypothetical protein
METEHTAPMNTAASEPATFTFEEMRTLLQLRARYAQQRDEFTPEQKARLDFIHWLHSTGRLAA